MASNDLVQSVIRGLDILEIIARADDGATLQGIAQALQVAPPTAHNIARTLVARGYLEKSSRPTRYRLGNAIFALVRLQEQRQFLQQAGGVVQLLAREMAGATVTLVEARGCELQVLLRASPELPGLLQRPDHRTMDAYLSAHGLVFQAFWTESERTLCRRRYPFDEFGAHAWRSLAQLDETVAEVRRRGYASPPSKTGDIFRVVAPIFTAAHTLIASLGMSLPSAKLSPDDRERIIDKVTTAARQLAPSSEEI